MSGTYEPPWAPRVRALEALADFLIARIAEDEAVAKGVADPAYSDEPFELRFESFESDHTRGDAEHVQRWHPSRVLAECVAKRRIVEECRKWLDDGEGGETVATEVLLQLGTVQADHPDYREEWRP